MIGSVLGFIGSGIVVATYFAIVLDIHRFESYSNYWLSILGDMFLLISTMYDYNLGTIILSVIFTFINLIGIYKLFHKKYQIVRIMKEIDK